MNTSNHFEKRRRGGAMIFGGLLVLAGTLFMLRQFNVLHFHFPVWPLFLVAGGIFSGIKHRFRNPSAFILIFLGAIFLVPEFQVMGQPSSRLVWPFALIIGGLFVVFRKPKNKCTMQHWSHMHAQVNREGMQGGFGMGATAGETRKKRDNAMNIDAIFGGRKEIITSRQFKGAGITAICGGIELNLMQADSDEQPMVLDVRVICGGLELIVPSHWEIVNELDVLFGGIDDKRYIRTGAEAGSVKTLALRGSVTFGGVEIKSY